jgi:hypothetical protein
MSRAIPGLIVALLAQPLAARAQQPLDGPSSLFQDSLVDFLSGGWAMTGTIRGHPVAYRATGSWVLGHQFLRFEMRDTIAPPTYEATVYIGYDHASERYIAHWLDSFGGRFSETLGYGVREGSAIDLVFEYPDGPFHTTFARDPEDGWTILMRQRGSTGAWQDFGRFALRHDEARSRTGPDPQPRSPARSP